METRLEGLPRSAADADAATAPSAAAYTLTAAGNIAHAAFWTAMSKDEAQRFANWCRGEARKRPSEANRMRAAA